MKLNSGGIAKNDMAKNLLTEKMKGGNISRNRTDKIHGTLVIKWRLKKRTMFSPDSWFAK